MASELSARPLPFSRGRGRCLAAMAGIPECVRTQEIPSSAALACLDARLRWTRMHARPAGAGHAVDLARSTASLGREACPDPAGAGCGAGRERGFAHGCRAAGAALRVAAATPLQRVPETARGVARPSATTEAIGLPAKPRCH